MLTSGSENKRLRTAFGRAAVIFFILPCGSSFALDNPVSGAVKDLGYLAGAPARINSSSIYPVAGLVGAGLLLYSLDGQIRHIASKNQSKSLNRASKQAEKLGNGGYDLAIAGAGALGGYLASGEKLQKTSFLAMQSFLAANAIGTAGKYLFGRSRPYADDGKVMFHPFSLKTARTSFPSGHTVSAFSVASVYASAYSDSFWIGASAYGLAGLVAVQRVYADKHWASDAFFGAVLGTAVGRAVAARGMAKSKSAATIMPVYAPGYAGAVATIKF